MVTQHRAVFPLMAIAALSLLAALWAGLLRLGWELPAVAQSLPASHGLLMIVGFLGTLIGLERAVAFGRRWAYGAPILAALAALALLFSLPVRLGHVLASASSLFLTCIFIALYRNHPADYLATMGAGAFLWFVGNVLWQVAFPLYQVVPWWIGFLVLTIAAERLELSRLTRLSSWDRLKFLLANGLFLFGLIVSLWAFREGIWFSGLALIILAFWLLRYDMAWRTVRQKDLPRFMAICLLSGYVWLGVGGLLWMGFADSFAAGPRYDAMLHAIFLGFVFSMIFAHAPIIFPAVTGIAMPFQSAFYAHLVLLHLSLLVRLGGDLLESLPWQQWGGLLNALTVVLFLANNVRAVRLGKAT